MGLGDKNYSEKPVTEEKVKPTYTSLLEQFLEDVKVRAAQYAQDIKALKE